MKMLTIRREMGDPIAVPEVCYRICYSFIIKEIYSC